MNITHGNILAVFFTAGPLEIQEGLRWYSNANLIARGLGSSLQNSCGLSTAAGVIAALSPNNRWERNVRDAEALIKAFAHGENLDAIKVSTFGPNKKKAIRILQGEDPLDVLGGRKVRAFYSCIIGGNDVCVDGHAYSIWIGQRISTSSTPKISDKLYVKIADDYRTATHQINNITGQFYTPAEIQAITWVTYRKLVKGEIE